MPTAEQRFVSFPNKYGPYVDTVGKNAKKIEEYIRNQLEEDRMGEQLTMGADVTATPPPVVLRIGAAGGIFYGIGHNQAAG